MDRIVRSLPVAAALCGLVTLSHVGVLGLGVIPASLSGLLKAKLASMLAASGSLAATMILIWRGNNFNFDLVRERPT
ncbi:hypothetical protein IE53DRAFT_285708 [Violaceomyces palustris]|uniref:Uncharacterized protein n=1 Tax=Violaceomyces palustris TaxID=1673888 RepID=A0ACD0NM85_9BASI|nr:hypothetical protein IE53DRAFT_285708 [Violaceomyces palustris]